MDKKQTALLLRLEGKTYAEIGQAIGTSRQYAQQLVRPPVAIYNLVRERAGNVCQDCGIEPRDGHVHHKGAEGLTPDEYNSIENLSFLCVSCHRKAHRWTLKPEQDAELTKLYGEISQAILKKALAS
jgi:5-methylcytosine-specific restriction endonuclease McrA